jgi:hypothetical protein
MRLHPIDTLIGWVPQLPPWRTARLSDDNDRSANKKYCERLDNELLGRRVKRDADAIEQEAARGVRVKLTAREYAMVPQPKSIVAGVLAAESALPRCASPCADRFR